MRLATALLALTLGAALSACSGGGRYGYSRSYSPLSDESDWLERANNNAVYDEVRRMPEQYRGQVLSFFGVVTSVDLRSSGATVRVAMQIRTHQERHLCEEESDSSCRVTVSARDGGPFTAVLQLRADDTQGENRVQVNSLLRVFGTLAPGEYDDQGGPVLNVQYYRHWPRGEYVTTAAASALRR